MRINLVPMLVLQTLLIFPNLLPDISGQCSMPSFLRLRTWRDSDKGLLVFSDTDVTGWAVTVLGSTTYETWDCYHTEVSGDVTYLILRLVHGTYFEMNKFMLNCRTN